MRLWSFHPKYLDSRGLVALWREALLALNVIQGKTTGYKNHPQLIRFQKSDNPLDFLGCYLESVFHEAQNRNYNFNRKKIPNFKVNTRLTVAKGQLVYEWRLFLQKLGSRNPDLFQKWQTTKAPLPHPVFQIRSSNKPENWEKVKELEYIFDKKKGCWTK